MLTEFNSDRFFLGKLCKNQHEWEQSEKSLRYLKSHQRCVRCIQNEGEEYNRKYPGRAKESKHNHYIKNKDLFTSRAKEYSYKNKAEILERKRKRYHQNKEFYKAWKQQYSQTVKGKATITRNVRRREIRKLGNHSVPYSVEQLKKHYIAFDNCCVYCAEKPSTLTLDHLIAVSKGGPDVLGNIVPACMRCNTSKGSKNAKEWLVKQSFYNFERWNRILKILGKTEAALSQFPLF